MGRYASISAHSDWCSTVDDFTRVIVAHRHQHAAVLRRPGHVGVAEDIAGAVHTRSLAVPEPEDAIMFALAAQLRLLRAPKRGRRQILVQSGLERHVRRGQQLARPRHLQVHRPQRRATIAGDKTGRVQTSGHVDSLLHQHQPHQRLRAVKQNRAFLQVEPVVQRNLLRTHVCRLPAQTSNASYQAI